MKKRLKKTIAWAAGITGFLVLVLVVHIYIVTRPKAPGANTIIMARVDLKQPISNSDAQSIAQWFYTQKGVEHVVCNAAMDNVVFTYYPVQTDGNSIVERFRAASGYHDATRFVPSEKDLAGGCPVAATSYTYKIYRFFKNVL